MDEGQLLAEARRRAGISQRELARRAGTSQAAVARIERARQSPSAATLRRLVAACGADLAVGLADEADDRMPTALAGGLLLCSIGGGACAFPSAAVLEVAPYTAPRRLPGQAADAGVVVVRGEVLPTIDAALRLGATPPDERRQMVILRARGTTYAVIVTAASNLVEVDPERMTPPPPGSGASAHVAALVAIEGDLVVVLDPEALCAG
jgi:chemotaxis signal transduction protein/DNA-binding XRE family transcriptional regulator